VLQGFTLGGILSETDLDNIAKKTDTKFNNKYPVPPKNLLRANFSQAQTIVADLGGNDIVYRFLELVLAGLPVNDNVVLGEVAGKQITVEQIHTKGYAWRDSHLRLVLPLSVLKSLIAELNFPFKLPDIGNFRWQDFEDILIHYQVLRLQLCAAYSRESLGTLFPGAAANLAVWQSSVRYDKPSLLTDTHQCVTRGDSPVYTHPQRVGYCLLRRCAPGNPIVDACLYLRSGSSKEGYVLVFLQYRHTGDSTLTEETVADISAWYAQAKKIAVPATPEMMCLYVYITNKRLSDQRCLPALVESFLDLLVVTRSEFDTFLPFLLYQLALLLPDA